VLWNWVHAPFGDTQPAISKNFSYNLRFPGQIFGAESGNLTRLDCSLGSTLMGMSGRIRYGLAIREVW
jgi:hypothetical protein